MTKTMTLCSVLCVAITVGSATAQRPRADKPVGVEAILADLQQTRQSIQAEAAAAEAEAREKAVSALEGTARKAISQGDVDQASDAWKQVLRLDRASKPAKAFFQTLRIYDQVVSEITAEGSDTQQPEEATIAVPAADVDATLLDLLDSGTKKLAPLRPATVKIIGRDANLHPLQERARIFTNRTIYNWKSVPAELNDWVFTYTSVGQHPDYRIAAQSDGQVYMLQSMEHYDPADLSAARALERAGWVPRRYVEAPWTPYVLLVKDVRAGEVVRVPHFHTFSFGIVCHPRTKVE